MSQDVLLDFEGLALRSLEIGGMAKGALRALLERLK
jgi:hypothetical protein